MRLRKLLKLGSSYVVTLPNEWIKENKLNKGDEISLISHRNRIILRPKNEEDKECSITLEFDRNLKNFLKKVISAYFKNYTIIEITGKNLDKELDYIKQIILKLSTLQIYKISREKVILKDMISISSLDFKDLVSSLVDAVNMLFSEVNKENINLEFIKEIDNNINKLAYISYKFINYNLNSGSDGNYVENTINFWRFIFALEEIADIVKRIARYLTSREDGVQSSLKKIVLETSIYFSFVSKYIKRPTKYGILEEYLDKKQVLLKEIELARDKGSSIDLYLVISQLCKDIIGKIEMIVVSLVDMV